MAEKRNKDAEQLMADLEASHPVAVAELVRTAERFDGYRAPEPGDTITDDEADQQPARTTDTQE